MKIVYMGTPDFAVPGLRALIKHHDVAAVFTQPDRPSGRGHKLAASPVKMAALEHGIEVLQPQTLRVKRDDISDVSGAKKYRALLQAFDADIFVVAAYGLILPKGVLNMPKLGCINIHASLLPKYRGASPIHATLLHGDTETGITIMHMDVGIDTGDMIIKKSIPILPNERFPSLHDRMAALGAECVVEAVDALEKGTAARTQQNDEESCYAPMIKKSDGRIDWNQKSAQIINRLRALEAWPGVYTMYNAQPLKIWGMESQTTSTDAPPGTILTADTTNGLRIKTADGAINITEIQPSGKKRMATADYLRGAKISVGTVLD